MIRPVRSTSGRTEDWFLTAQERGNTATSLAAWCHGNRAEALVHGETYFDRLVDEVGALRAGDHLFFTGWRGDRGQHLRPGGPTLGELFGQAAARGVVVKGLVWRSYLGRIRVPERLNRRLKEAIEAAGGEVLLDQRVRVGGSHHQKLVILRHPDQPDRDVAFAGGIDLSHSRRDGVHHRGDPQRVSMSPAYGRRPPWHDVQVEVRGPAVGALDTVFRERWEDCRRAGGRTPLALLRSWLAGGGPAPGRLPARPADPPVCGTHAVQVLRTYPVKRAPYHFAPDGERSIARGYTKVVKRARRLIYIEDQYLWSAEVARLFARALRDNPDLHLVIVLPRYPDLHGSFVQPPNIVGRAMAIDVCRQAGGERVHCFDVENHDSVPVYVHAKVCVVDDVWVSIGSDNFNRRSWTHDSELSCAVLDGTRDPREPTDPAGLGDGARCFARDLRLRLWREHLDRAPDGSEDEDLLDPGSAVRAITASAEALEAWHASGRGGPRPPGRLRPHRPKRPNLLTGLWAVPVYRLVYDPDGRPWRMRRRKGW
ncbi:MAG TPA: phospholipase D family protein [Micromonosporaceae bacterium]|nr:phospholipase D family protein [Micromonosporaceae bacterium]